MDIRASIRSKVDYHINKGNKIEQVIVGEEMFLESYLEDGHSMEFPMAPPRIHINSSQGPIPIKLDLGIPDKLPEVQVSLPF